MASKSGIRLLAVKCLIVALTLIVGFGLVEAVLRSFPSLIGISLLTRMEPTMRSEIAGRLGLPTMEAAIRLTPDMRTDRGPTILLPAANSLTHMFADKADLDRYAKDGYKIIGREFPDELEGWIKEIEAQKISFKGWATPGATPEAAALDVARTVARRAERRVEQLLESGEVENRHLQIYLNRLSDLLWLMARWAETEAARI